MFLLNPISICDICLERYGQDSNAPTALPCGHIFCLGCLHSSKAASVSPLHQFFPEVEIGAPCPLCRTPFLEKTMIKLHIEFDDPQETHTTSSPPPAETEARRFQDAFVGVARQGIRTEREFRHLLDETKAFLSTQSRGQFKDLRVTYKVMAYLYEVKSKMGGEIANHLKEISRLKDENLNLQWRLTNQRGNSR